MNRLELAIPERRFRFLRRAAIFAFGSGQVFQPLQSHRNSPREGTRWLWLVPTILLVMVGRVSAGDLSLNFGWQNLEFRTYASNSIQEVAECRVDKIFLDHRKLGFFRINLLPVLVVQGLHLQFAGINPTNEWAEAFQSDWLPNVRRGAVEWRDVDIGSQKAGAPRLHAGGAQPVTGTPTVCLFKNVTVEANGVKWRMPQAELRNEDGCPRIVWKAGGGERRLDLFSGEVKDNPKQNGVEK